MGLWRTGQILTDGVRFCPPGRRKGVSRLGGVRHGANGTGVPRDGQARYPRRAGSEAQTDHRVGRGPPARPGRACKGRRWQLGPWSAWPRFLSPPLSCVTSGSPLAFSGLLAPHLDIATWARRAVVMAMTGRRFWKHLEWTLPVVSAQQLCAGPADDSHLLNTPRAPGPARQAPRCPLRPPRQGVSLQGGPPTA